MKKYATLFVVLLIGITLGNRIYNHFHAWVGLAFILAVFIYVIFQIIQYSKDKEDEKVN